ncbi:actin [Heterostelium album PN500]|uniref:Actin n=1 Tax=Heterostelium pallidum (strain ATCC 26659 / Pp 5 / PN500) TaxID=670386 RepID=D3BGE2_HETP5|nr:actin [Heterostelium album PN500]EFA79542.1 actin [Heterostelium album PN500]|eukprot:XP_020431663.1 actin [Heterostelium album PN500]
MEAFQSIDFGKAIVIDNGSFKIKSGFAGDLTPKLITPTSCAREYELAMLAANIRSGVVVDCGDDSTRVLPVYNGRPITEAFVTEEISGKDITEYLAYLIESENGSYFDQPIITDIKEKVGYVATDYNNELRLSNSFPFSYEISEDELLSLGSTRVRCPEPLFQPRLINKKSLGVHTATFKSINMCKPDIQSSLYENILLVGGSTLFPGFSQRLYKELSILAPVNTKIRIIDPPTRQLLAWLGGSMAANEAKFTCNVVSKKEYEEYGTSIINQRFISSTGTRRI